MPPSPVQTWLKPRPVQLNEGRIEISVPYYIGVIAGLVVLVVVLTAFRLGQAGSGGQANEPARQVQAASDQIRRTGEFADRIDAAECDDRYGQAAVEYAGAGHGAAECHAGQPSRATIGSSWRSTSDRKISSRSCSILPSTGSVSASCRLDAVRGSVLRPTGLNARVLPSGEGFLLVTKDSVRQPEGRGYRWL